MKWFKSPCRFCLGEGTFIKYRLGFENNFVEEIETCTECNGCGLAYNGLGSFILYFLKNIKHFIKYKFIQFKLRYIKDEDLPF